MVLVLTTALLLACERDTGWSHARPLLDWRCCSTGTLTPLHCYSAVNEMLDDAALGRCWVGDAVVLVRATELLLSRGRDTG